MSYTEWIEWEAFNDAGAYPTVRVDPDPRELRDHRVERVMDALDDYVEGQR